MAAILRLNVGGEVFLASRSTLMASDTFFRALAVQGEGGSGEVFIDRDPTHFRHVLNWLRGVRALPRDGATLSELWWEADFYSMADLRDAVRDAPREDSIGQSLRSIACMLRTR